MQYVEQLLHDDITLRKPRFRASKPWNVNHVQMLHECRWQ